MGLFTNFKKMFNKTIALMPHQRADVVSFVKLKSGMVKIGADAIVEDNYNLIFVYYNKVCDILKNGEYKINDETVPKLFRNSKAYLTKRGLFSPNSIKADVYYVSLKEFTHNMFKTQERIIALNNDEKVKLNLEGTFSFRVVDSDVFMKALCNDYAIIRNKKIMKELCSTVGFEVSKSLSGKRFTIDDYIYNKEKIIQAIQEGVNKHTITFGVEVTKFFINNIVVARKNLTDSQFNAIHTIKDNKEQDADVVKLVEERFNSLQKDLSVVYVNEKGENSLQKQEEVKTINLGAETFNQSNNEFNLNTNTFTVQTNSNSKPLEKQNEVKVENNYNNSIVPDFKPEEIISSINQPEPSLFGDPQPAEQKPVVEKQNKNKKVKTIIQDELEINDELVDSLIEKINTRKKQKGNDRIAEILSKAGVIVKPEDIAVSVPKAKKNKVSMNKCSTCGEPLAEGAKYCFKCGKSTDELKVCACCGAKNFANAEICCVCKSKLD